MERQSDILIVGFGVQGKHAALEALQEGLSVRVMTSPSAPVAGANGIGIIERQDELITLSEVGDVLTFTSEAFENEGFQFYEQELNNGAPWIEKKSIHYHRMADTSPDDRPFPGMERETLSKAEVREPYQCGYRFKGYILNTRMYLAELDRRIFEHPNFLGLQHGEINSPDEVRHPVKIITCGMGQKRWDREIFPGLGETMILELADVDRSFVIGGIRPTYSGNIVPIPGTSDRWRCGASKVDHCDITSDHDELWTSIREEVNHLRPEFVAARTLELCVAARPKRNGGVFIRIYLDAEGEFVAEIGGLGGAGFTLAYAIAKRVVEIIRKHLNGTV